MKKVILVCFVLFVVSGMFQGEKNSLIIPENAIRFRVIANSNSTKDQAIKTEVRDQVQDKFYHLLSDSKSEQEARDLIKSTMPEFETMVKKVTNQYQQSYKINYGMNYFPKKIYKGVEYPEGNYESFVITLGDGLGDNWWCVLFPPLCLLEAEETETTEVEYKFFVEELFHKFFPSN